ncbi:MAG: inositol monophosphatase [Proteobacteria bacterium]|nr:MAG: inositol monophosphatase [Pseudomonadota bacterium]
MLPEVDLLADMVSQVAQDEIMTRFGQTGFRLKGDGSLVTEADLAANQRLCELLKQHWPSIAFLSEEMDVEQQEKLLLESDWLWCLDPLDGTTNFAAGVPLFATSLALFHKGKVVMGITYDPVRQESFTVQKGQGAFLNGVRLQSQPSGFSLKQAVALLNFKRLPSVLQQVLLQNMPFASQRNLGACTLEWAWIAANRGQVYLHGGMKIWDLAVGTLLLSEAGGYACTLKGEAVFRPVVQNRSVVASLDKALFEQWYQYLQQHDV